MALSTFDKPAGMDNEEPREPQAAGGALSSDFEPAPRREFHRPVLVQEALRELAPGPQGVYLDATLGEGGHSLALLNASSPGGRVVALDRDPRSVEQAKRRLEEHSGRFFPIRANYVRMGEICNSLGLPSVNGVLMDLGLSSRQLEEPGYGFSFQSDEPLDMRYNPEQALKAWDIVNTYTQDRLADVIYQFGEERRSRAIARAILRERPLHTTGQLAQVVARASGGPRRGRRTGIHPATRTFQSLRIAVNSELEHLRDGLNEAIDIMAPQGRLVVISYHSLEDRIVKTALEQAAAACVCPPQAGACVCGQVPKVKIVTRRVVKPSRQEIEENPRSRSARMRVAERL